MVFSQPEGAFFAVIERFRVVILTSPLWLAGVMLLLDKFGGPRFQTVVDSLTASPMK